QQEVQGLEATATEAMQLQQGMYGTPSGGMEQPFDGNYFYSNYHYVSSPKPTSDVSGFGPGFGISQQASQIPSFLWSYGNAASSDEQQMTNMTPFLQQRPEANAQQANAQQANAAQQQTQQSMEQEPQEEKVVEQLEVESLQETEDERLKRLKAGDAEDEYRLWEWRQMQEHMNMRQGPPQEEMIVDQELQPLQETADERLARLKNDADDEWKQTQSNMIGQSAQTRKHLPQCAQMQQQQPLQMQYPQLVRAVPLCMMTQEGTVTPIFRQLVPAEQMQQPIGK
ncbi:unnamed protein product, partial [Amoebophrya sp. A25]